MGIPSHIIGPLWRESLIGSNDPRKRPITWSSVIMLNKLLNNSVDACDLLCHDADDIKAAKNPRMTTPVSSVVSVMKGSQPKSL